MTAPVAIRVTRTKRDYVVGVWHAFVNGQGTLPILIVAVLGLGALKWFMMPWASPQERLIQGALQSLMIAVMFAGFYGFVIILAARRNWRSPGALSPIEYVFTSESLKVKSEFAEGESKWNLWKSALETRDHILVRTKLNLMHILPKRDIPEPTQRALKALLSEVLSGRTNFKKEAAA